MTEAHPPITPDHVARLVMFTYGKMVDGKPFWCYLAVKPSRKDELVGKINTKTFDINRYEPEGYGEIVVSGEGVMPPTPVIKKVAEMFNVTLREMFQEFDADAVITKEVERVKGELGDT